jgi:hypothetical protein
MSLVANTLNKWVSRAEGPSFEDKVSQVKDNLKLCRTASLVVGVALGIFALTSILSLSPVAALARLAVAYVCYEGHGFLSNAIKERWPDSIELSHIKGWAKDTFLLRNGLNLVS